MLAKTNKNHIVSPQENFKIEYFNKFNFNSFSKKSYETIEKVTDIFFNMINITNLIIKSFAISKTKVKHNYYLK